MNTIEMDKSESGPELISSVDKVVFRKDATLGSKCIPNGCCLAVGGSLQDGQDFGGTLLQTAMASIYAGTKEFGEEQRLAALHASRHSLHHAQPRANSLPV
ncbi:MAG: hypothetical protein ACRD25_07980 [Terracidiphilus sp.]